MTHNDDDDERGSRAARAQAGRYTRTSASMLNGRCAYNVIYWLIISFVVVRRFLFDNSKDELLYAKVKFKLLSI